MAKIVKKVVKIELPGGEAKPGPKLASAGIIMPKFCTDFNAKTANRRGETVPVIITAYDDKSYSLEIKTTPTAELLLKYADCEVKKGTSNRKTTIVGNITIENIRKIAEYKLPDLNCYDIDTAIKIIKGSAFNIGLKVVD